MRLLISLIVILLLAGCSTTQPPLVCPEPIKPLVVPEVLMQPPSPPPTLKPCCNTPKPTGTGAAATHIN